MFLTRFFQQKNFGFGFALGVIGVVLMFLASSIHRPVQPPFPPEIPIILPTSTPAQVIFIPTPTSYYETPPKDANFEGKKVWKLVSYTENNNTTTIPQEVIITAHFESGIMTGYAACNVYEGKYTRSNNDIKIDSIFRTKRGCNYLDYEQSYVRLLHESEYLSITMPDETHLNLGKAISLSNGHNSTVVDLAFKLYYKDYPMPPYPPIENISPTVQTNECMQYDGVSPCLQVYKKGWHSNRKTGRCEEPHAECGSTMFDTQQQCEDACRIYK